ncbi:hypothetical protein V6N13_133814 [Hibiscus sabdariffa]
MSSPISAVKAGDNLPVRSDNSPACNDHSRVAQGSTWLTGSLYGGIRSHEASRAYDARVELPIVHEDLSFHADSQVVDNLSVGDE